MLLLLLLLLLLMYCCCAGLPLLLVTQCCANLPPAHYPVGMPILLIALCGNRMQALYPDIVSVSDFAGKRFGPLFRTLVGSHVSSMHGAPCDSSAAPSWFGSARGRPARWWAVAPPACMDLTRASHCNYGSPCLMRHMQVVLLALFNMSIGMLAEYITIGTLFEAYVMSINWPIIVVSKLACLLHIQLYKWPERACLRLCGEVVQDGWFIAVPMWSPACHPAWALSQPSGSWLWWAGLDTPLGSRSSGSLHALLLLL